jgi:hypothetical protein
MAPTSRKRREALTAERARQLLSYDPDTGVLLRLVTTSPRSMAGMVAGSKRRDGYRKLLVDRVEYFAHRVAWLLHHGEWPDEVDHINGDPSDNRMINLRSVTHAQNTRNSRQRPIGASGYRGVRLHRRSGLWRAVIGTGGQYLSLGYFKDPEEAHKAYCSAVERLHGEHAFNARGLAGTAQK